MWAFDGTPEALLPRILDDLDRARAETRPQLWFLRQAFAGLVGRYILEDQHGPVTEPQRSWFLRESTTKLLALPRDHFTSYALWAEDYALRAETDEELWFTVCMHRSALQLLIDDYAHTPIPQALDREHLDEIDQQIRASVKYVWPVPHERIPSALTGTHWWWHLPDSATG